VRLDTEGEPTRARSNFVIFETLSGQNTQLLCAGEYRDVLVRQDGALKFAERLCIFDTTMIPSSIVMPI
jgi:3-phenylpropionate/cinnamic acid dioxygenase small subunit